MMGSAFDVSRLARALVYSARGFRDAFMGEPAVRLHLALILVMTPLALWLGDSGVERALMTSSLLLMLIVEMLNSAVEAAIDRIGPELHELSRKAKDIGAAAVVISILTAVIVWTLALLD